MGEDDFKPGDYVEVSTPNGSVFFATVEEESYAAYWLQTEKGGRCLIPKHWLRPALRVREDTIDPVTRARQEYDRLKQGQEEIDRRKAELQAEQDIFMQKTYAIRFNIRDLKDQRRTNSARMAQLKTFLEFAETI